MNPVPIVLPGYLWMYNVSNKGGAVCPRESAIPVGKKKMLKAARPARMAILYVKTVSGQSPGF